MMAPVFTPGARAQEKQKPDALNVEPRRPLARTRKAVLNPNARTQYTLRPATSQTVKPERAAGKGMGRRAVRSLKNAAQSIYGSIVPDGAPPVLRLTEAKKRLVADLRERGVLQ